MVNNINGNKSNPLHCQTQQRMDNNNSHRSSPLKSQTSKLMNNINGHKFSSLHRETEHRLDNTNGNRLSLSGRKTSSQEIHSCHIVDEDHMQVDIEENAVDNANEVHEEENEIDDTNGAYEEENNLVQAGSGPSNAASITHDTHGSQSVSKKRTVPIDPITNKKIIRFDIDGNPVGIGSTLFVHDLGKSLRTHIPICFEHWKKVPQHLKEGVWMDINKEYLIPKDYKRNAFKKMSKMFRNAKLRYRSHLDNCRTNAERIRNCPEYIRPEDWKKFIEIESTPEAYEHWQRGKAARSKVTNYHMIGKLGSARIEDIMEKLEAVISANPESVYEDIDNDPIAQVYGPDKRENVRELTDVSRRTVLSSAFAREQLENETKKRMLLEDKVDKMQNNFSMLERNIDTLTNALNTRESIILQHPSVDSISSHTRFHAGYGENHDNLVQEPCRECPCELISFGNYMVARGRALIGHSNDVSLDVIINEDAPSFAPDDSATTLGEICIGETIKWPNVFTKIIGG